MIKYFNLYSFSGFIKFLLNFVRTRLFYKYAKIIRFPFDVRGYRYMRLGKGFTTGIGCRLEAYPINNCIALKIGENVQMNDYVHITAMKSVVIGKNVLMASRIYISDCSHGSYAGDGFDSHPDIPPILRKYSVKEVIIEDNVWLGESVSVLPGVIIGKGSIIGANSVVTKDIPQFVIAVGIPAKPIKKFNFEMERWEIIK